LIDNDKKIPDAESLIKIISNEISKEIDLNTCLIGIPSGGHLIIKSLQKLLPAQIEYGLIDASFYRDDLEISGLKVKENITSINFDVNNKKVILIDDVFFTGRTIRAAINEIFDYGRPKEILLYVLINRQLSELPIKPNFSAYETNIPNDTYIDLKNKNGKLQFITRNIND
jgi:pyrimidine operon attenuation protein/uracil phosphoribosyltransferase|tara:strand:+ start:593 stop:1105 length:513 start_codon:yes stop_codon:yes gene_type:complete